MRHSRHIAVSKAIMILLLNGALYAIVSWCLIIFHIYELTLQLACNFLLAGTLILYSLTSAYQTEKAVALTGHPQGLPCKQEVNSQHLKIFCKNYIMWNCFCETKELNPQLNPCVIPLFFIDWALSWWFFRESFGYIQSNFIFLPVVTASCSGDLTQKASIL